MRTKMFNLFSLVCNALASVTCIISIALMVAYGGMSIFTTASFYLTIITFITVFIGMRYNVKTFNMKKVVTPNWYVVLRITVISSLLFNTIMSLFFTDGGAWTRTYVLTRLTLPILLCICFIFFDVDSKVPLASLFSAPSLYFVYYAVFLPLFAFGILKPHLEIFDVKTNDWTVTLLLVICSFACLILITALLRALNFSIHYAAYGKIEQEEFKKQIELAKEKEREEELLKEVENIQPAQVVEPVEASEPILSEAVPNETKADKEIKDSVRQTKTIKKVETPTTVIKSVNTETKTNKKVSTETESIKKVDTSTKSHKKVNTNTTKINKVDTQTRTQVKVNTATKTINKIDNSTKTIKKVDTSTKTTPKIDTATRTIRKVDTSTKTFMKLMELEERVYHVIRHDSLSKWQVKYEGASRALKLFKTQLEAINYAKELVKTKGGSIVIHSANGKIRKA